MKEKQGCGFTHKLATFIVDKRNIFFLIYAIVFLFCIFSMNWVDIENDVTVYLSEDTETRQGLVAMNENFTAFATAQVMVANITYEEAEDIAADLAKIEGVELVAFDNTAATIPMPLPFLM